MFTRTLRALRPLSAVQPLKMASRHYSAKNTTKKIRNIGIIAHIDAGKTTTTERILYLSGTIKHLGNVDEGDTTMDFLPAERERGITIASAATSFNWNNHTVNLIDTPGHADFTFEVIRSIRVLDGAVCILDGVAGVEAQTEKVWKQASEMGIPKIAFVNKMDRAGAGFGRTVKEIVSKLRTRVALLTVPVFSKSSDQVFEGVVDILNGCVITWTTGGDGKQTVVVPVSEASAEVQEEYQKARTALVETLTELDEELVEKFLESEDYMQITTEDIKRALRTATINNDIVPVLCGASFRNIGVQPLMDAVVDFLPSPAERPPTDALIAKSYTGGKKSKVIPERAITLDDSMKNLCCALCFKVVQDPQKGTLVYVRVYKGELKQNSVLYNTTSGTKDRVSRLLKVHADTTSEVTSITEGNIGVILGSQGLATGDTIVCHSIKKDGVMKLPPDNRLIQLKPIAVPPPVFFVRIDPASIGDTRPMNEALELLLREDPSLNVSFDDETNQTTLSGMGELHLEIAQNRLIEDFKANIVIGPIIISYKETLNEPTKSITKTVEPEPGAVSTVRLRLEPITEMDEACENENVIDHEQNTVSFPYELFDADLESVGEGNQRISFERDTKELTPEIMEECFRVGSIPPLVSCGPVCRLPLRSVRVVIEAWHIAQHINNTASLKTATRLAIMEALSTANATLMEPIMNVYVSVNEADIGLVVKDLSGSRNGQIVSIMDPSQLNEGDIHSEEYVAMATNTYVPADYTMYLSKHQDQTRTQQSVVHARVPLREMVGYLKTLRSMTQGRGSFTMEVDQYEAVTPDKIQPIVDSIFA
ncbi:ribosome-releasing factor 2, mitochondrial [Yarrowia lipolytica]|jgi:elongation factor G|uniref:Ribosome-releasing factor 2, mitochondrial n=1 Tax=Yarrowia lipolytica TaxID=4952 RepID=A0A371C6G1_YARLL|nr:ribosome-releasing factor 2, mitochondrial [Yarrowia lipolytica]RDW31642.1 ribosome-releasing factor 2, mitochondrial [Yarrowia lipolytica]RDW37198.1 ribosome-releasing factor 2, mitochondrial [Yarrowia lipolytica]RDW45571.1 ribosome-releasing factor 2, mitochondrial [Yarrowia lipolytica]RDW52272.1 ribosome-releasing factor 2, mitochondrial [Yarrowia lipolytica]